MGHRCDYTAKLISKDKIYFKLYAKYKNLSAYVYKEYLDGTAFGRYIYYTHLSGYIVTFPGEKFNSGWSYWGIRIQNKETLSPYYPIKVYSEWKTRDEDLIELEKNHPEFKYFIKKQHIHNIKTFIEVLKVYQEHPEIEPLLELNYAKVILDKRLYSLSDKKKKQVMNYIRVHKDELGDEVTLTQILYAIKGTIRKARGIALMEKMREYNPNYKMIKGYSIFIPNDMKVCELQASRLNQCIITCNYVSRMAKRQLVLIFIQKDGNPIATCEIDNQTKEIKQFYADEHDRENCLPTRKMRNAMNEYIAQLDLNNLYVGA